MLSPNIHQYRLLRPEKPRTLVTEELGTNPSKRRNACSAVRWRFVFFAVFILATAGSVISLVYTSFRRRNSLPPNSGPITEAQNTLKRPDTLIGNFDIPSMPVDGDNTEVLSGNIPDHPEVETENGNDDLTSTVESKSTDSELDDGLNNKNDNTSAQPTSTDSENGATEGEPNIEIDGDDQTSSTDPENGTAEDEQKDGTDGSIDAEDQIASTDPENAKEQVKDGTDDSNDHDTPSTTVGDKVTDDDTDTSKEADTEAPSTESENANNQAKDGTDDSSDDDAPSINAEDKIVEDDTEISKDTDAQAPSTEPENSAAEDKPKDDTDILADNDPTAVAKPIIGTDDPEDSDGDAIPSIDTVEGEPKGASNDGKAQTSVGDEPNNGEPAKPSEGENVDDDIVDRTLEADVPVSSPSPIPPVSLSDALIDDGPEIGDKVAPVHPEKGTPAAA